MIPVRAAAVRSIRSAVVPMRKLSGEQKKAVTHVNGPMLVVAGPGSGKTTVITERIKYLIESAGVSPADILVITFTRAAAYEMEQRFKALMEGSSKGVRFGTFHSVYFWIIKTAYNLHDGCVISEEDKRKLISDIMASRNLSYENKEDVISSVISQISLVKCDMLDMDNYYSRDIPDDDFKTIYKDLCEVLKKKGLIDFDDMLTMCYELLSSRADILDKVRSIFKYVMVDEFQDSNLIQYKVLRLITAPADNLFAVGDDDQSIYGFRGARPEIMLRLKKDYRTLETVYLSTNYRCASRIGAAASSVISENRTRFKKSLRTESDEEGVVRLLKVKDDREQCDNILRRVFDSVKKGIPLDRQAVIYRTNIEPRKLCVLLDGINIPYTISDSLPNIFDHFVVRGVLDYMAAAHGDLSRERILKIMYKPSRYIKRDALIEDPVDFVRLKMRLKAKPYAIDEVNKLESDLKLIARMRPVAALTFIRRSVGYDDYIKHYAEYKNIAEDDLFDMLEEYASVIADVEIYDDLLVFIEDYKELLKKQSAVSRKKEGLNLLTMHSAKGLEFDSVYIMDAVEGLTPYKKAKTPAELEEERRMFYVAMTRAKSNLYIYVPETVRGKDKEVSRFVKSIRK